MFKLARGYTGGAKFRFGIRKLLGSLNNDGNSTRSVAEVHACEGQLQSQCTETYSTKAYSAVVGHVSVAVVYHLDVSIF